MEEINDIVENRGSWLRIGSSRLQKRGYEDGNKAIAETHTPWKNVLTVDIEIGSLASPEDMLVQDSTIPTQAHKSR